MALLIGIDGGGTKTQGYVIDEKGNVLGKTQTGSLNIHSQNPEKIKEHFSTLINELCKQADSPLNEIDLISVGVAGIGRERDCKSFQEMIFDEEIVSKLYVTTDIKAALVGAHGEEKGIFVLSGTGSIAYGMDGSGNEYRVGGWGHILGDEGSGYDIGRKALASVAKMMDDREQNTTLKEKIFQHFNVKTTEEFVTYVYHPTRTKADIACVVPIVHECSLYNDPVCHKILVEAVDELVAMTVVLIEKIEKEEIYSVSMGGGIFNNIQWVYEAFSRKLKDEITNVKIHKPKLSPEIGAIILGCKKFGIELNLR